MFGLRDAGCRQLCVCVVPGDRLLRLLRIHYDVFYGLERVSSYPCAGHVVCVGAGG